VSVVLRHTVVAKTIITDATGRTNRWLVIRIESLAKEITTRIMKKVRNIPKVRINIIVIIVCSVVAKS
jgi:hypothetical protein